MKAAFFIEGISNDGNKGFTVQLAFRRRKDAEKLLAKMLNDYPDHKLHIITEYI